MSSVVMLETTCDNETLVNITDASGIVTKNVISVVSSSTEHSGAVPEKNILTMRSLLVPTRLCCSAAVTNRTTPSQSMLVW